MDTIYVPLEYKLGEYCISELQEIESDSLEISIEEYDVLSYETLDGQEVTIYSVTPEMISTLKACYDEAGGLHSISIIRDGVSEMVYIHYADRENTELLFKEYAMTNAERLSTEILKCKAKVERLFIETFYDGDAVDFAVKIATTEDVLKVIEKYDDEEDTIDSSGNYPVDNRITCDENTFRIMLLCADMDDQTEIFENTVQLMTAEIESRVLEYLDKTENFKLIVEEYD